MQIIQAAILLCIVYGVALTAFSPFVVSSKCSEIEDEQAV